MLQHSQTAIILFLFPQGNYRRATVGAMRRMLWMIYFFFSVTLVQIPLHRYALAFDVSCELETVAVLLFRLPPAPSADNPHPCRTLAFPKGLCGGGVGMELLNLIFSSSLHCCVLSLHIFCDICSEALTS